MKNDIVLLVLLVILCASIAAAVIEGTSSLAGIGFIYLAVAIVGAIGTRRWDSLKPYLMLAGGSVIVFFLSMVLYNIFHRLFQQWFGFDFWSKTLTGDEFFFFSIAVFLCPIGFIIGIAGSISIAVKKLRRVKRTTATAAESDTAPLP